MKKVTLPLRVRFCETDAGGVVYHGRYFEYFEAGRNEFLTRMGLSYKQLVALGYHLPVIEAQVRYLSPAFFDDKLDIEVSVELQGSRVIAHHKITREGKLLTEAKTVHAFINKAGKPVRPLREFTELITK